MDGCMYMCGEGERETEGVSEEVRGETKGS
jgi:hypothetical protein